METWHKLVQEYSSQGLRPIEVTRKIEEKLGLNSMYDKVRHYMWRHKKKAEKIAPAQKRVIVQNQEPIRHDTKWDGCKVIKIAIIGDTQFGSKYAQLTYLHEFYDLCSRELFRKDRG